MQRGVSNRSVLARAGEQSLNKNVRTSAVFDPKQILKKLGLGRLRKMQALVRGFLVRRQVYPRQLEKYLIAQSLLQLIEANVIYREASAIIVESVTYGPYDAQPGSRMQLEEYLYDRILGRAIQKEFEPIAKQAIYEFAMLKGRPTITHGFNLRQPLELLLFGKLDGIIEEFAKEVAEEAVRQQAQRRRELAAVDQLLQGMEVIGELCQEIVDECLLQMQGDFIVEEIIGRIVKQGAQVAAQNVYCLALGREEDILIDNLAAQAEEWMLQAAIIQLLATSHFQNTTLPTLPDDS